MQIPSLDPLSSFSMGLILAGAMIMAWCVVSFVLLVKRHKTFGRSSYEIIRSFATTPFALMCFFLAGYFFVLFSMLEGKKLVGDVLVGLIFFGGAIFVKLSLRFQKKALDELEHNRDKLRHEALHDPLTGLANRRLLLDRIGQVMLRAERSGTHYYALVFMDIDRFKVINDSLGHALGDKVLQKLAGRIENCLRGLDTVARFGGDEFVLLLDNASPRRAIRIVRRVRKALRRPMAIEGHSLTLNASYGIVLGPTSKDTPEQLLQNSTLALHRAKATGRDRIKVYKADMLDRAVKALALEHDLRRGIDAGEIVLYYQPVIALHPEPHLAGFEALARWRHPKRGLVPPNEFIPLAEETGLIVDLGDEVIRLACRTIAAWRNAHPQCSELRMALNVSARQFTLSNLTRTLRSQREKYGLPAEALTLEITETALMDDPEATAQRLRQFRREGFNIAIDDFGQGYSSLAYIKDFPADIIKIDRAFVSGIDASESDLEIVRCMVLLAHTQGMRAVAEGVETEQQLARVAETGCDCVQGYFFSHPIPESEAETLARTGCSQIISRLSNLQATPAACGLPTPRNQ